MPDPGCHAIAGWTDSPPVFDATLQRARPGRMATDLFRQPLHLPAPGKLLLPQKPGRPKGAAAGRDILAVTFLPELVTATALFVQLFIPFFAFCKQSVYNPQPLIRDVHCLLLATDSYRQANTSNTGPR